MRACLLLMSLGSLLVACSPMPEATPERSALTQRNLLRGKLGPEGGELRGEKGSLFNGFVLSVPRGALASEVELTVRLAAPPSILPGHAVAIAPRYVLEPAIELRQNAHLTLPITNGMYAEYDGRQQRAVAFRFDGRDFVRHEASASEFAIDFDVDVIDSLIPTFDLIPRVPLCVQNKTCLPCARNGFCVGEIANTGEGAGDTSTIHQNALHWVTSNATGSRGVRVNLATGATSFSGFASSFEIATGAVAANQNLLYAAGLNGTTLFDFDNGGVESLDTDLLEGANTNSIAPVRLTGGEVARTYFELKAFSDFPALSKSRVRSATGTFETRNLMSQQQRGLAHHFGSSERFFSMGLGLLGFETGGEFNPQLLEVDVDGSIHDVKQLAEMRVISRMSERKLVVDGVVGTEVAYSKSTSAVGTCQFVGNDRKCSDAFIEDSEGINFFALDQGGGIWYSPGNSEIVFSPRIDSPTFFRHALSEDFPGDDTRIRGVHSIGDRRAVLLTITGRVVLIEFQE